MLNDFTGADKVYIACGYTDLRKGIDGLARMVQQQFELDPFTNTLFLFCGRRRDRFKGLYWEKDGFILLLHFIILLSERGPVHRVQGASIVLQTRGLVNYSLA